MPDTEHGGDIELIDIPADDEEPDVRYPVHAVNATTGRVESKYMSKGEARKFESAREEFKQRQETDFNTRIEMAFTSLDAIYAVTSFEELRSIVAELFKTRLAAQLGIPEAVIQTKLDERAG